ncbi:G patch domain and ankyrin repeat-containing protein 1 [Actinomortierella wolfii]|nr:G patch domain and ankyrin repeat-containing protein 1 [Actinomortierella wolfii]
MDRFYRSVVSLPSDATPKSKVEHYNRQLERKRQRLTAIISGKIPTKPAMLSANTAGITKSKRENSVITGSSNSTVLSISDVHRVEKGASDSERIWCSTCLLKVHKDDALRHQHGTAHLLSQDSAIRPLDSLILSPNNKGFKMMLKSGWDYEKGLGAQGQGRRHPIATQLRQDRRSLGSANEPKKVVTHKIEEIESARQKASDSGNKVIFTAKDHHQKARQENQERLAMMKYMKS